MLRTIFGKVCCRRGLIKQAQCLQEGLTRQLIFMGIVGLVCGCFFFDVRGFFCVLQFSPQKTFQNSKSIRGMADEEPLYAILFFQYYKNQFAKTKEINCFHIIPQQPYWRPSWGGVGWGEGGVLGCISSTAVSQPCPCWYLTHLNVVFHHLI